MKINENFTLFVIAIILIAGVTFFVAWLLMLAWNAVLPELFGLPSITFWQAFLLQVIIGILGNGLRCSRK